MGALYRSTKQIKTTVHGAAEVVDLYIPFSHTEPGWNPNGRAQLQLKTQVATTALTTKTLGFTVAPIITPPEETAVIPTASPNTAYTAILTPESVGGLTWEDGSTYVYEISFVMGVAQPYGYQVTLTPAIDAGEYMTVTYQLVVE